MGEDRRDRLCPNCGLGVLPTSPYCIRCGVKLPPLPPREEAVAAEEERRRWALAIWFFDLMPGLLSGKVMLASAGAFFAAGVLGLIAWPRTSILSPGSMLVAFSAGALAMWVFACGMMWIFTGDVLSPLFGFFELRLRQWLVLLGCMAIAVRLMMLVNRLL